MSDAAAMPEITDEMRTEARGKMLGMLRDCGDEDDKMGCVTDLLKAIPPEVQELCQPRLVLLTQEGCDACATAKKDLAAELASGAITEKKIFMGDGKRIAEKNGLKFAPSLVIVDCEDNLLAELTKQ